MIDNLFTGNVLGHESDIADGRLRGYEFRSLNNIVGDYYVSPRFLEAVAVWCSSLRCSVPLLSITPHLQASVQEPCLEAIAPSVMKAFACRCT